ncbi:MAG TPA: hypothetical protein VIH82_11055 [Acidimicrobiia bacterium]|jgi:hypothetical protein
MAEESSTADVDMQAVEAEIRRLPDVAAVRVVTDDLSRPVEVHVLANTGKHAKQVVRDVQSVALASFNLEIDRRIVSVVQLAPNGGSAEAARTPAPTRVRALGIQASTVDLRSSIRVTLEADEPATGFAEGAAATAIRPRLVAAATLDALRQLEEAASRLDVVGAEITRVGAQDIALVTLVSVEMPLERHLVGSAIVHHSPDDAIVRAVLDAANRRLSLGAGEAHHD